jgi:hypothetical protein
MIYLFAFQWALVHKSELHIPVKVTADTDDHDRLHTV